MSDSNVCAFCGESTPPEAVDQIHWHGCASSNDSSICTCAGCEAEFEATKDQSWTTVREEMNDETKPFDEPSAEELEACGEIVWHESLKFSQDESIREYGLMWASANPHERLVSISVARAVMMHDRATSVSIKTLRDDNRRLRRKSNKILRKLIAEKQRVVLLVACAAAPTKPEAVIKHLNKLDTVHSIAIDVHKAAVHSQSSLHC